MTSVASRLNSGAPGTGRCALCGEEATQVFLEVSQVPVHVGVLYREAALARGCARGDLVLEHCRSCDHIANRAFDPGLLDYTLDYDNSLHASDVFRRFEADLLCRLTAATDLAGRVVVEVGPGDGRFLRLLCEATGARGIGFEPGLSGHTRTLAAGLVEIRGTELSADAVDGPVDLLCCRHVLEHLHEPTDFLECVHSLLSRTSGSRLYLEVPNGEMFVRQSAVWDLVYEHCQYFTAGSMRRLVEQVGFRLLDEWAPYERQFLSIEATIDHSSLSVSRPARGRPSSGLHAAVERFSDDYRTRLEAWRERFVDLRRGGSCAVLWGAGARAVSFANALTLGSELAYAVDINPAKQGTFLAGTGHPILPPEALIDQRPDVVIVVNPIYFDEVRHRIRAMGVQTQMVAA